MISKKTVLFCTILALDSKNLFAMDCYEEKSAMYDLIYGIDNADIYRIDDAFAHGASINSDKTYETKTPLALFIEKGKLSAIAWLLKHGANPNKKCSCRNYSPDEPKESPLFRLSFHELTTVPIVKMLASYGADLNTVNQNGMTLLMQAAQYGDCELTKFLLGTGKVNVNQKDNFGRTALIHAAIKDHRSIITLLLKAGADKTVTDNTGRIALQILEEIAELTGKKINISEFSN